jgi:E3 ubiquitin-protein ligase TRIP12
VLTKLRCCSFIRDMAPIFQGLGMFVGRALYDSRIIDLHFNKVFLKAILGDHVELSLETLKVTLFLRLHR